MSPGKRRFRDFRIDPRRERISNSPDRTHVIMIANRIALALFLLTAIGLAGCATGCANKQPETGITPGGQSSGYKAESAAKKQNRVYEAMQRNMRSLAL